MWRLDLAGGYHGGMIERTAIVVSFIAFCAACVIIIARWDWSLFVFRGQFSLRTLLILLAVLPPLLAAGWIAWPAVQKWFAPTIAPSPPALDFTSHVMDKRPYLPMAAVGDGKLVIGKRSYGPVRAGDQIRLGRGDDVFVNGQRRRPE